MENKKYRFLDIARGIAIILMVLGHCVQWNRCNKVYNFIYLFHMAVFMFISGFLFKNRSFNNLKDLIDFLKRKIKKLYLFYLKYEVLFLLLTNLFISIGFYNPNEELLGIVVKPISSVSYFIKRLIRIILLAGNDPLLIALWFIISLICIIFGYSIIKFVSLKQKIINPKIFEKIAVIICFIIGCCMRFYDKIPTRVGAAFVFMLIYDLGNEAYIHKNKLKFNNYFLTVISFCGLLILNNFGHINMSSNEFSNPLFFMVCSLLGIYLILSISNLINEKSKKLSNFLEYLGNITLTIMTWHLIGFKIAMIIQFIFLKVDFKNLSLLLGYQTKSLWLALYLVCGIGLPVIIDKSNNKIKCAYSKFKLSRANN